MRARAQAAMMATMKTKRELAATEDAGWKTMLDLVESLTPHQVEQEGYYPESWSARIRMLTEWNALPEVTSKAEEWFAESGPDHYEEHMDRLRDWVAQL